MRLAIVNVKAILESLTNGKSQELLEGFHGSTFKWYERDELLEARVQFSVSGCNKGVDC